jgi:hypothetical protein
VLEALDELVRGREAALPVLLTLARRLLITLVHRVPLTAAREVHTLFDAKMVAAPRSHTAFAGRLLAVPLVPNPYAGTRHLTSIDVVASVAATHRLEDAGAIAVSGAWNAPVGVRIRGEAGRIRSVVSTFARGPRRWRALVADEAVIGRPAMHRFVATAAVLDVMLAAGSVLDGIRLAVFTADESLEGADTIGAGLTTTDRRRTDGSDDYTS